MTNLDSLECPHCHGVSGMRYISAVPFYTQGRMACLSCFYCGWDCYVRSHRMQDETVGMAVREEFQRGRDPLFDKKMAVAPMHTKKVRRS